MRLARVRATAYPKLTLSLRVLGRRADGFHDLEALVVSLGQPHDVLEAFAVPAPGGVQLEVVRAEVGDDVPADHRNLAFIAAERLMVRAGRSGHGVRLVLRKQIPAGAGLGGGSADAAAALLVVRDLLDLDIDDAGVLAIGAEVGSDVPFCLHGGAAWMRGRGRGHRTGVAADGAGVRGGDPAVPALDPGRLPRLGRARRPALRPRRCPRPAASRTSCRSWSTTSSRRRRRSSPASREFRAALEAATGAPALLAGSGSAYVVPIADARRLPAMVEQVSRRLRVPVVGTTSVSRGVRLAS